MNYRSSYELDKLIDKLIDILEPIYLWIERRYTKEVTIKKRKQRSEIELSQL
jgi:hypothetical protein